MHNYSYAVRDTDLLWNCFVNWAETRKDTEAERKILSLEGFEAVDSSRSLAAEDK